MHRLNCIKKSLDRFSSNTRQDSYAKIRYETFKLDKVIPNWTAFKITMFIEGFNAKDENQKYEDAMEKYVLGNTMNGATYFYNSEVRFTIINTQFKLFHGRLYTWKSPADTGKNKLRNHNYININQRFRNSVRSAETYTDAEYTWTTFYYNQYYNYD